jgi:FAD/FMN-containing dehydrogenase
VATTLPEEKLLTEGKIVHGRSRDFSWRNPYLKQLFETPFGEDHSERASLFEAEDVADMSDAARMCHEHEIPLVMRGEGSGYTAGAFNFSSGLVLDTTRMNRVLDIDASKGTMKVEAGMRISDAREVAQSVGWDLRQYPASSCVGSGHEATIGGFLQTTPYGVGSARYGSLLDFGNILDLRVVPITKDAHPVTLDAVEDREMLIGSLRGLGTAAIVNDVTLSLCPAHYWVDVALTFPTSAQALSFALNTHNDPSFEIREMAAFPSSLLTSTLNQGERKTPIHFLRNKIPPKHRSEAQIAEKDLKLHPVFEQQTHTLPEHIEETEALVTLSVNESALPFLTHLAKEAGGHAVYFEHSRGGYGWLDATSWQQANTRLARYYTHTHFSHYELDLGALDARFPHLSPVASSGIQADHHALPARLRYCLGVVEELERKMDLVTQVINQSIDISRNVEMDPNTWVDETELLSNDIKTRPAWFAELIRRKDGRTGVIGQMNFRTQISNFAQLESRLTRINRGLHALRQNGILRGFVDPHKYTPEELFIDDESVLAHEKLRLAAKAQFDPSNLLNPRVLHPQSRVKL